MGSFFHLIINTAKECAICSVLIVQDFQRCVTITIYKINGGTSNYTEKRRVSFRCKIVRYNYMLTECKLSV